jgi:hypothetical protein
MSAAHAYPSPLRAERGGLAASIDLPPTRMTPAEISLTLSADVLRLPYLPATRLVMAEIVSLYAANSLCDASDAHFSARLSISTDTVSRAVKELYKDGLIAKDTTMQATGLYRTLVPIPAAIAAKSATNPYPQNAGGGTRKMPVGYPQNAGTPTRKMPVGVPAKCGSNTPFNIPSNIPVNPTPSADASAVVPEKKIEEDSANLSADEVEIVPPVARPPRAKPAKPGEPEHFATFWQAWPKKEARADALKAFAKLSPADQAAAASRADTWLASRPDLADPTRYRFIPHATTWLNQERWADEAPALATSTHVNPTANPTQRPANGAKPTADAGELAAALFDCI